MKVRFIADQNVGKLGRWLRLLGYDTVIFKGEDDGALVRSALTEGRVLLTRDTQIGRRKVVSSGRLKMLLIEQDEPLEQVISVVGKLGLIEHDTFSRCLECNALLEPRIKEEMKERVPPYVFKTQETYMECPACHRIYWKGTHWQSMQNKLEKIRTICNDISNHA